MNERWRRYADRFDGLARRERIVVALGLLLVAAFLGYSLLVEPPLLSQSRSDKRLAQAGVELPAVQAALAQAQAQLKDPEADKRAALQEARRAMAQLDAKLRALSVNTVPAAKVPALLEALLARNPRLELLSLRTLPASPLVAPGDEDRSAREKKRSAATDAGSRTPNIYKHGVELRIAGSYGDLLVYLEELERAPQRILWSKLTLAVEQYPRSVLTLTVYTLSLDKQWLVV